MNEQLSWALERARRQTQALVADIQAEGMCRQSAAREHHPGWILGHLLLSDTYLLSLLGVRTLSDDFPTLLGVYGPNAPPTPSLDAYLSKEVVLERLADTGSARLHAVRTMVDGDFARATPDITLARSQPTIGHHLHALVFHEVPRGSALGLAEGTWSERRGLGVG